jgi:hypothetical protein
LNCEQKHCTLFSRAAKILKFWTKALYFVQPRRENLRSMTKSTVFYSAPCPQRNVLDLRPKALYFVQPRSEIF